MSTNGEILYITPQPDEIVCPHYPCISLSQFAANSSSSISNSSNITLYLLPGHHTLDNEILVSNVYSFIVTNYMRDEGAVLVECNTSLVRLNVNLITFVHIKGWLHFIGCGRNKISMVDELVIEDVIVEGVVDITALELRKISFAIIARTTFNASSYTYPVEDPGDSHYILRSIPTGGAITITFSNIVIESCVFEGNIAQFSATAAIFADKTSNIHGRRSRSGWSGFGRTTFLPH